MERLQGCSVQQTPEDQSLKMPCQVIGTYLRQKLKPSRGSIVGLSVRGEPTADTMIELYKDLSAHGFEAGSTECFISERDGDR
jgi:hypothetical protein